MTSDSPASAASGSKQEKAAGGIRVEAVLDVGKVPSAFPVGFCLLTQGERQYVVYYDAEHRMTVAARTVTTNRWQVQVLPEKVGWDSHNSVTMTADDEGYLHLSGNMHAHPLVYFRTARPWDITTFERLEMTGKDEKRCTYPRFMRGADGRLIFHYRDGGSGNGNEIYNVYDVKTRTWGRLLDKPLTDGRGQMNAYMVGPSRGPDGWFHLCWVWRDTPDCSSNHDPSYARSRDLVHWETIAGRPIELPITLDTPGTLIDPVPVNGGIINGALQIGFDRAKQPVASYHKFDQKGKTQVYVARFENGKWRPRVVSDWDYRWEFQGGGSIVAEIRLGQVRPHGEGRLALSYTHVQYGDGWLVLDEKTLERIGTEPENEERYPPELSRPESSFPRMRVKWAEDSGTGPRPGVRYVLRWETLPPNRDAQPKGPLPEPSMLRLYTLSRIKAGEGSSHD